jgi:predicted nucleotidyltransferase
MAKIAPVKANARHTSKRRELARIKRVLKSHLPELRKRYAIQALGVFGSYVRGEQRKRSDLDLLVQVDHSALTLLKFIELENTLSDLVKVKVDLVDQSTLKPDIGRRILAEVEPL